MDLGDSDKFVGDCITVETKESSRIEMLTSLVFGRVVECSESPPNRTLYASIDDEVGMNLSPLSKVFSWDIKFEPVVVRLIWVSIAK